MTRRKAANDRMRVVPSWTGDGHMEVGGHESRNAVDWAILIGALLGLDVAGLVVAMEVSALTQPSSLACSDVACFPNPHRDSHNAIVMIVASLVVAAVSVGVALAVRLGSRLVIGIQLALIGLLAVNQLVVLLHAQSQQRELQRCGYGTADTCHGVRNLGPANGEPTTP